MTRRVVIRRLSTRATEYVRAFGIDWNERRDHRVSHRPASLIAVAVVVVLLGFCWLFGLALGSLATLGR